MLDRETSSSAVNIGDHVKLRRATVTYPEGAHGVVLEIYRRRAGTEAVVSFQSQPPGVLTIEDLEVIQSESVSAGRRVDSLKH